MEFYLYGCSLVFTDFHVKLNHIQNVHIIHRKNTSLQLYILYLDYFLLPYRQPLVVITVCHLTAESKITDVFEVKR